MQHIAEKIIQSSGPTLPIIIDELGAIEIIRTYTGRAIISLDEILSEGFPGVFYYEKEEERKHLSIGQIRRWIEDIHEISYEQRALYILRDFDEATADAMHASLKILEEPPAHAIIILIVKSPNSLLETIRSRCISLFHSSSVESRDPEIGVLITAYQGGDIGPLIQKVSSMKKIDAEDAMSILLGILPTASTKKLEAIEEALLTLFTINESPRNILDTVLLSPEV